MAKTPSENKKTVKEPRKLKVGAYRSFRLHKPIKSAEGKLPSAFKLFKESVKILLKNWRPFFGIVLIYGFLNIVLVQSFNGADLDQTKTMLDGLFTGQWAGIISGLSLFVYMAGASGNINSDVAGAYQLILTVTASLALIWVLRQVYGEKRVRARDGFYKGMHPLVPFLLVLLAVTIQLAPVIIGGFLYNLATAGGIAVGGIEAVLWAIFFFMLALTSLYMLSSSLLALYIVCLPDMTPMIALRSARDLVRFRRWAVIRKIIFLPIFLLVAAATILLPVIFISAPLAGFVFFVVSMCGLPIIHSYMYLLYRELL